MLFDILKLLASFVELRGLCLPFSAFYLGDERNGECLSSRWGFYVLGHSGRSQNPLTKGHLVSWNNMDSITDCLCRQIHLFKHKYTPVSQACIELKYQPEIPLPVSF